MSDIAALAQLGTRIAKVHGWLAAKAFKAYRPSDRDKAVIAAKAGEILKLLPHADDGAAAMSAAFAVHIERDLDAPVQLISGELSVLGEPLFAPGGHAWVMVGPYVADISIFCTAYSRDAPARLMRHVYEMFGRDQALLFAAWRETRRFGFDYVPQQVLSSHEIDGLLARARKLIESRTP